VRQFYRRRMERKIAISNTVLFAGLWAGSWLNSETTALLITRLCLLTLGFALNSAVVLYCYIRPPPHWPPPPSPEKDSDVILFKQKHG
jgi:hypothetical protein